MEIGAYYGRRKCRAELYASISIQVKLMCKLKNTIPRIMRLYKRCCRVDGKAAQA